MSVHERDNPLEIIQPIHSRKVKFSLGFSFLPFLSFQLCVCVGKSLVEADTPRVYLQMILKRKKMTVGAAYHHH